MRVSQIYVYPIKSMRGISLSVSPTSYTGLLYDRCFALVNTKTGKHLLVAENTEMCLFVTAFDVPYPEVPKKVVVTYTLDHIVGLPEQHVDRSTLEIDLLLDTHGMEEMVVEMNSSPVVGFCVSAVHDAWFSTRLGYEVRLLYIGNNRRKVLGNVPPSVAGLQRDELSRSKDKSWSDSITSLASTTISSLWGKSYEGEDHGLLFSDLAPFLIISATSCENAQRRLPEGERLDITKFRANIVVEGAEEAFEEDYWAELLLDSCNAKLILTQNCARCNSLNVDYDTGKVGQSGAGKLIKKLNSDRRVDRGIMKWNPVFGRYAFLAKLPPGKSFVDFSVGSEVTVIRKNNERTTLEWPF